LRTERESPRVPSPERAPATVGPAILAAAAAAECGNFLPRCEIEIIEIRRQRPLTPARFALAWAINALALWIANGLLAGVWIHGWTAYLLGAAVLGIANTVLKPLLALLTLPLILVTFGLFYLLINMGMIALAAWITPNFSVHGFWTYVGAVVIVWLVNWASNAFVDRTLGARR
jgi:putative membrane protein